MKAQFYNFVSLSLVNIFVRISGLLVFPFIAKKFSLEVFAMYALAQTVGNYFSTFSDMGVKRVAIRELNIIQLESNRNRYIRQVTSLRSLTCLFSFMLMNIIGFVVARDHETRVLIFLYSLSILPLALDLTWVFDAKQDMGKQISFRIIERICCLLISVWGVLIGNIMVVAVAGFFSNLVAGYFILYKNRNLLRFLKFRFAKEQILIFKESIILGISTLITPLLLTIDLFFVNYYLTKRDVALYGGYEKIVTVIISFGWILAYSVYPELARLYGLKKFWEIKRYFLKVSMWVFLSFIPVILIYFCFAEQIIILILSKEFLPNRITLHILMLLILPSILNTLYLSGLNAFQMSKQRLLVTLFGLLLNIGLCLVLIPKLGILGASLSTLTSNVALTLLALKVLVDKLYVR